MSYTPFNAPLLGGLLGDSECVACFAVKADLDCMIRFEQALASAQAVEGMISQQAADAIGNRLGTFEPDIRAIGAATARDGVVVPELVRQMRDAIGEPHAAHLHYGATSQDLIDTSFIMRIKDLAGLLDSRLQAVESELERLEAAFGSNRLMARTRMQAATSITVADRIAAWRKPVAINRTRLDELLPRLLVVQLGGASGTLDVLGDKAAAVRAGLARRLEIGDPKGCWHADRSAIAEFANWLSLVTGALGKIGQDIALMAQNGIDEIVLEGTGSSSAMAHKRNPVLAETLVTLARFNATQLAGMHHALVHEQERSGAAWTLEWMLMPQMCVAAGASTRMALSLLAGINRIGS